VGPGMWVWGGGGMAREGEAGLLPRPESFRADEQTG